MDIYNNISIDSIKSQLTQQELMYVDDYTTTSSYVEKQDIMNVVSKDTSISEINRFALLCLLTTFDASSEYWNENGEAWCELIDNANSTTRSSFEFNARKFAFADAWWAYQGLLSSGCNIYVGAGAAAVGSAFSCLK